MSRIDEALRRSGAPVSTTSDPAGRSDVFVSPWEFGRDASASAVATAEPPTPTAERVAVAEPDQTAGKLLVQSPTENFRPDWKEHLITPGVDPALVEQFRRLAASLLHGQRDGQLKVVMISSAAPGEGKTMTALNLALVLTKSYRRRVLLVDADLRRPRITEAVNLSVTDGLGEALKSPTERKVSLVQLTENLTLLPAGRPDPDPLSGLTSSRMQRLLEEAAERFDWVIVDTPPIGAAADASLLGAMVDAAVLVVRAEQTPHAAVVRAIEALGRDRIFGVVLNGVRDNVLQAYGDYPGYTYGARP